jgi:23S rRNA (guanine745-N1)-methyltransferase
VLADVVEDLICPHCGAGLRMSGNSVRCPRGHVFDVARQGYVNLLPGEAKAGTADTAEMVEARALFLGSGSYEPVAAGVADAVLGALDTDGAGCVVDVGAGTGYYLARVLDEAPLLRGLALDLSKYAARRAARAHPRAGSAVADTWGTLPVLTGAAAFVLDVFAPRNGAEFARILAPQGALIVVTPNPGHLSELVTSLGLLSVDPDKQARLAGKLDTWFRRRETAVIDSEMLLGRGDVAALIGMGPSAWHSEPAEVEAAVRALPEPMTVTLSVEVAVYRKP